MAFLKYMIFQGACAVVVGLPVAIYVLWGDCRRPPGLPPGQTETREGG